MSKSVPWFDGVFVEVAVIDVETLGRYPGLGRIRSRG